MLKSFVQQKRPSLRYQYSVRDETHDEATRAALSDMGSCVDDLHSREDQTLEFASIFFYDIPSSGKGRLVELSPASSLLDLEKEAMGERWSLSL